MKDMKDEDFIMRFKERYKMSDNVGVIFTDAFKIDKNESTGIGIVIKDEEKGF